MIDHNHPAVEAARRALANDDENGCMIEQHEVNGMWTCLAHGMSADGPEMCWYVRDMPPIALTAALPHLTADDLRDTDVAEEIRTEGWLQGWAAGRDLDGDEDAIPYLRHTPAGRALMAEAWDALIESMSASGEFHDVDLRTMQRLNPYRKADA